jgi:DNA repair photolyase
MTTPKPTNAVVLLPTDENMAGKPVFKTPSKTALAMSKEFAHKTLTSGPMMNLGDACAYDCTYCFNEACAAKRFAKPLRAAGLEFQDIVSRRCANTGESILTVLDENLATPTWRKRFNEHHVLFTSSTVDPAPNAELLEETAQAILRILKLNRWHIRVLSKSTNLPRLARRLEELYPGARERLIFGVSTGTLDDKVARAIEVGTPLVTKRIKSLRQLQDEGFRTFGMICPSLPQHDYRAFSDAICEAVRVDRCEHVWAEPINVRGKSFVRTIAALRGAGLDDEADSLATVSGTGTGAAWDDYAKATFVAHAHNVPPEKLRFLHYPTKLSLPWWREQVQHGAVLLGKLAHDTEEAAL